MSLSKLSDKIIDMHVKQSEMACGHAQHYPDEILADLIEALEIIEKIFENLKIKEL